MLDRLQLATTTADNAKVGGVEPVCTQLVSSDIQDDEEIAFFGNSALVSCQRADQENVAVLKDADLPGAIPSRDGGDCRMSYSTALDTAPFLSGVGRARLRTRLERHRYTFWCMIPVMPRYVLADL